MDEFAPKQKNGLPKETGWAFADQSETPELVSKTPEEKEKLSKKIIVAEDEKDLQGLYFDILSDMGYSVEVVGSGELLLQKTDADKYDLVITDNNMVRGGLTGLQVLAQIRAKENFKGLPRMPIIVCSGDGVKKEVDKNNAVFLPKPFRVEVLRNIVPMVIRDQEIRDRMMILLEKIPDEKMEEFRNEIFEYGNHLRQTYQDPQGAMNYAIFHPMFGSTIDITDSVFKKDDFPGDDSVEKFLKKLEEKYLEKQENNNQQQV